jgi:radical SAM protein with 4Fe4S-binding SPASM domain
MEYVNINALKTFNNTSFGLREELISKLGPSMSPDHVIATDELELLCGEDLVQSAVKQDQTMLPLRRLSYIKKTNGFPKRILLELTSKCNSFCTMCPRNVLTRKQEHMDTQLAKSAIKQLAEGGISGLWLYNIGESLLHPDFFEILDYCRTFDSLGTIWLSTNGGILDEEMRERLLDQPVDILNYSVNSMSEEQFRKITKNLDFYLVQNNLKAFVKRKKELGKSKPIIRAQMIEIPYVLHEIEDFKREYGQKVDIISINKLEVFSQNVEANNPDEEFVNTSISKCNRLEREDFFIFSDGSVSCCDTDFDCALNIGNIKEQSIKEIYEGEKYQGLIRQYHEGRLHEQKLCSRCRDFDL